MGIETIIIVAALILVIAAWSLAKRPKFKGADKLLPTDPDHSPTQPTEDSR